MEFGCIKIGNERKMLFIAKTCTWMGPLIHSLPCIRQNWFANCHHVFMFFCYICISINAWNENRVT